MDMQLKGKRALVTGASSGIGQAIALELAAEGVDVAVSGRDKARTEGTARQIEALGGKVLVTLGDVEKDADAFRIADEVTAAWGGVDILVNNAGNMNRKDVPHWLDVTPDEYLFSASLNLAAAVRLCQKLCPGMVERGWGRVINISSMAGTTIRGRNIDYASAKAALDNFSKNLSKVLGPDGVTVNIVAPGPIITPAVETWMKTIRAQNNWSEAEAKANEREYARTQLHQSVLRYGEPREIATAVALLASPLSGFINGVLLPIDGGGA